MIRFGPGGIPLSCKGRTLRDSIMDLHHLGLTAMEVQFIKVSSAQRAALPEEIGRKPLEIPDRLIVDVSEPARGRVETTRDFLTRPLTRKNRVTTVNWLMAKDYFGLLRGRELSRSVDIRMTMHAPYYVDFLNSEDALARSMNNFRWASVLASAIGADMLVGHMGFYGPQGPDASIEAVIDRMKDVRAWLDTLPGGQRMHLGIEPNGHPEVIGSKEEVMEIARKVPRSHPVLNIPHLAVREGDVFANKRDLESIIEEFSKASHGDLYLNFSGVDMQGVGTFRMTPIKRGMVKFENIAEVLSEMPYDVTVISSSPLMEHDAMYLRLLYERTLAKQFARKKAPPPKATAKAPKKKGKILAHKRTTSKQKKHDGVRPKGKKVKAGAKPSSKGNKFKGKKVARRKK